jgi:hypothetical protein
MYRCAINGLKMALTAFVLLNGLKNMWSSKIAQKIVQLSEYCNVKANIGESSKPEELADRVPFEAEWIYTYRLSTTWLLHQLCHKQRFETNNDLICIGYTEASRDKTNEVVVVRDTKNRIPLVGPNCKSLQTNDSDQSQNETSGGKLICIKINSIIACAMCLGRFSSTNNCGPVDKFYLPPVAAEYQEIQKISGACSIFSTGDFVFLVVIHIEFQRILLSHLLL